MTTLTTEILKENIVEILPVIGAEDSFFSKVGVRNITVSNLDLVRQTSVGPAGIVFEGQVKPDTQHDITDAEVIRFKSVATVPVSKELQLDREGQLILGNLLEDAAKSLIDAPAVALLTGLDLNSASAITQLENANLYDNGLGFEAEETSGAIVNGVQDIVFANNQVGGTMVVNSQTWTALAGFNVDGVPGARLFPELNDPNRFNFTNTLGGFLYRPLDAANAAKAEGAAVLDPAILAVVGPFHTNVGVSITVNDVRVFREQWKEINLASKNIDMFVLEADVAMWVMKPEEFNVLKVKSA